MNTLRKKHTALALCKRILLHVRPYWPHLGAILALELLATPIALLIPLPLKIVVDSVIGSHPLPGFVYALLPPHAIASGSIILYLAAGLLLLVTLLGLLQKLGSWLLNEYTGQRIALRLQSQLFQQAQRLSLVYHDTAGVSDATYRIQYDALAIQRLVTAGVVPLIGAAFTLAGMIYVTARISPGLALVALAISPLLVFLTWFYSQRLWARWRHIVVLETSTLSVVQEVLGLIRVVKAFGQEQRELDRFVRRSRAGLSERIRAVFTEGVFSLLVGLTIGAGTAIVLFIGVRQVQSGAVTLGELLLIMAYLAQLYEPLRLIGQQIASQQAGFVGAERAFSFLDEVPPVMERKGAKCISRAKGAVAFRDVSFSYRDGHVILSNISFEVAAGMRAGIVGPTGVGKTTLISLLTRLYDPTNGAILLDGVDLRDYRLDALGNQFAVVLQDSILFSSTVAANIAYARPDADMGQIMEAAKAANAHEFIVRLPQGYDTPVGEHGMLLSGGERQRIALARAFLKDAPILILDEPTSAVDMETEAAVMQAMERLTQGRTSFLITHRPTMLKNCDVLLRLEHGGLSSVTYVDATAAAGSIGN
jgi:ATP-binding cassette, subfamily B, bacterial